MTLILILIFIVAVIGGYMLAWDEDCNNQKTADEPIITKPEKKTNIDTRANKNIDTGASTDAKLERLEKLAKLYKEKVINAAEYKKLRKEIMGD